MTREDIIDEVIQIVHAQAGWIRVQDIAETIGVSQTRLQDILRYAVEQGAPITGRYYGRRGAEWAPDTERECRQVQRVVPFDKSAHTLPVGARNSIFSVVQG